MSDEYTKAFQQVTQYEAEKSPAPGVKKVLAIDWDGTLDRQGQKFGFDPLILDIYRTAREKNVDVIIATTVSPQNFVDMQLRLSMVLDVEDYTSLTVEPKDLYMGSDKPTLAVLIDNDPPKDVNAVVMAHPDRDRAWLEGFLVDLKQMPACEGEKGLPVPPPPEND